MENAEVSSSSLTDAEASTADKILDAAKSQLGVPYVWGGESIAGFDCSGLTQWCAAQAGVIIPRTSQEQWAELAHVLDVVPGDLIFFHGALAPGEEPPGHVGIVSEINRSGKGPVQMIDAPFTGTVVRYDSVTPGTAYGIVGYARVPEPVPAPTETAKPAEATTQTAEVKLSDVTHYAGTCLVGLPLLRSGDVGWAVAALGVLLGELEPTTYFDAALQERVLSYQVHNSLSADGIVGAQTWTHLLTGEKVSA